MGLFSLPEPWEEQVSIRIGEVRAEVAKLPPQSIQCVITSPPYFGLRAYGSEPQVWGGNPLCHHSFERERYYREGGSATGSADAFHAAGPANAARIKAARWREEERCACGAWRGELGMESSLHDYVAHLVEVFQGVRAALADHGTVWLNMGDAYESGTRSTRDYSPATKHGYWQNPAMNQRVSGGLRPKNLLLLPHRVAIALQADGWVVRQDIVWAKPNPMPESVTDRPTRSHEYLFLLSKRAKYYFDQAAIREPAVWTRKNNPDWQHQRATTNAKKGRGNRNAQSGGFTGWRPEAGRNKRSVWTINTQAYRGAHFSTFPPALVEPCLKAGCPVGGLVLDPFAGSGTVGAVALGLGRRAVLIDLQPAYRELMEARLGAAWRQLGREEREGTK